MSLFPMFLKLEGRSCLVVGAGAIGEPKIGSLLASGASVRVIAAQAKGLSNRRVIFTYAARNALLPQLQGFGLAVGFVISGALVMEIVFSYPGIGLLLLNAVTSHDYPLMQGIFLVITFAVLIANLVVDMIIVFADPRARTREATA